MTDEAIKIYRDDVMQEYKQQPGFKGGLFLIDRAGGKGISITFYESERHLKATKDSGHYQRQIGKFSHLITTPVVHEDYEVAVHDIEMGSTLAHASVTFAQFQSGSDKQEEVIKIFRDSVLPEMRQFKGFKGAILLLDRATSKAISFGMYETEAEMHTVQKDGHYRRQVAKFTHLFSAASTREVFEVAFHDLG